MPAPFPWLGPRGAEAICRLSTLRGGGSQEPLGVLPCLEAPPQLPETGPVGEPLPHAGLSRRGLTAAVFPQTLCLKTQGHPERYKAASRALKAISKVRQLLSCPHSLSKRIIHAKLFVVLMGKGTRSRAVPPGRRELCGPSTVLHACTHACDVYTC